MNNLLRLSGDIDVYVIRGDIDGPRVCYCVEPRALRRLKVLVAGL